MHMQLKRYSLSYLQLDKYIPTILNSKLSQRFPMKFELLLPLCATYESLQFLAWRRKSRFVGMTFIFFVTAAAAAFFMAKTRHAWMWLKICVNTFPSLKIGEDVCISMKKLCVIGSVFY